jgi:hypothetical protein
MKVVITGGRNYVGREHVFATLDAVHAENAITLLIHGACGWDADDPTTFERQLRGADGLADAWAASRDVPIERVPAAWTSLGGNAGPIRNGLMLDRQPEIVIAFPGDRGTRNCTSQARKRGIRILGRDHADHFTPEDDR